MKRALLSAVTAALATAAVLATVGFGASSKTTTNRSSSSSQSTSQTQSGPPKTMKQVYEEMQKQRAAQQKKLADAIGVSVADLEKAQDKLKADRLAADVKANRLTQAQADAIEACEDAPLTCDRSNLPAGGRGHRGQRPDKDQYAKDLAAALNVDVDKVTKALESTRPARAKGEGFGGRGHRGGPGHGPGGPMGGPMGGPGMMG